MQVRRVDVVRLLASSDGFAWCASWFYSLGPVVALIRTDPSQKHVFQMNLQGAQKRPEAFLCL